MDTNAVVAPTPTGAIPSSTFSVSLVNAVLGSYLESCASIEEIANDNSLSIPVVMQCLDEQKPFLLAMLSTLELRVRLLAARAEAVAIESLREIAYIGRDPEARRKAASKLLSHFARASSQRTSAPSPRPAGRSVTRAACDDEGCSRVSTIPQPVSASTGSGGTDFQSVRLKPSPSPGPHAPAHSHVSAEVDRGSPPSPRTAGSSAIDEVDDDEGCSNRVTDPGPL